MTYYLIAYDPPPSANSGAIADSIREMFPEHWLFIGTTWTVRTDKPVSDVQSELTDLLRFGRLLCLPLLATGSGYTTDQTGPLWLAGVTKENPSMTGRH